MGIIIRITDYTNFNNMRKNVLFSFMLLLALQLEAQITSVMNGNWNTAATWDCSCVPTASDDVIIAAGTTVSLTTNQTVNNVTLSGTLNMNTNGVTLTVNGNFTVSGSATILGGAASRDINISGNFIVNAASSVSIPTIDFRVTGTTTINGSLTISSNTGVKDFTGTVTNNGTWTSTVVSTSTILYFRNGIINNGTFNARAARFATNNQVIGGTSPLTFDNGSVRIEGAITLTNQNPAGLIFGSSNNTDFEGTVAASTFSATNNAFTYYAASSAPMNTGIMNASGPNTFVYNRNGAQNVRRGTYYNLIVMNSGTKGISGAGGITVINDMTIQNTVTEFGPSGQNINVGNTLTIQAYFNQTEGVATTTTCNNLVLDGATIDLGNNTLDTWVINNDFTVTSNGGTLDSGGDGTTGFNVANQTLINGPFTITRDNSNQRIFFNGLVTISATGSWTSTGITSYQVINFRNNIIHNGTSFNAGAATFTTNNQSLTGNTYNFTHVYLDNVTLTNTTTVYLTLNGTCLSGAGTWQQDPNSFLYLAGDAIAGLVSATAVPNTVTYYGARNNHDVNPGTYYNLVINKNTGNDAEIAGASAGTINIINNLSILGGILELNTNMDQINVMAGGTTIIDNAILETDAPNVTASLNDLTLQNAGTITGASNGNVVCNTLTTAGTGGIIGRCNFTTNTTSTLNAALTLNDNNGIKIFIGTVTLNAGGSWTSTTITTQANLVFRGGIVHNGTSFSAASATFNTNDQSLSGSGTYDFSRIIDVNAISLTNAATVNHTYTAANGLTGTGSWVQAANSIYNTMCISTNITFYASASNNIVNFYKNNAQTVHHPVNGEFFHLYLSNSSTKTASAGNKIIHGNVLIQNTAAFDVNTNAVDLEVRGNWLNTSTSPDPFIQGTRTVTFNGSNQQTVSNTGDQQGTDFYNVVINNTSMTGVVVTGTSGRHLRIVAGGTLTLTDGYVYTNSNNLVEILDDGNATGGNTNSFVTGPIRKIGNDAFVFPTGQDVMPAGFGMEDVWARIAISAPANTTTQFTAQYYYQSYSDLTIDATLTHVSFHEYWTLDRAVTTDAVQVTLYYESATRSYITDYMSTDLVVARYTSGNFWTSEGQSARSNSDPGWITSNAVTNFSPFTFGSITGGNPFPVEWMSFGASPINNSVQIQWTTATERNLQYFQVEKSQDGQTFTPFHNQIAIGNSSSPQSYQTFDYQPYSGVSYYRIKAVDFDGKVSYSNIVAVNINITPSLLVFPNPTSDVLHIQWNSIQPEANITVFDLHGKLLYQFHEKEVSSITLPTKSWASGLYILKIQTPSVQATQKIIKQ